jgi:hypothetical protein
MPNTIKKSNLRSTFSFANSDIVMKELWEIQHDEQYGVTALSLQEILKLAVSRFKRSEKLDSGYTETAYINSQPGWAAEILRPFDPASDEQVQTMEEKLGIKLT